jgi:hypothetical protein
MAPVSLIGTTTICGSRAISRTFAGSRRSRRTTDGRYASRPSPVTIARTPLAGITARRSGQVGAPRAPAAGTDVRAAAPSSADTTRTDRRRVRSISTPSGSASTRIATGSTVRSNMMGSFDRTLPSAVHRAGSASG